MNVANTTNLTPCSQGHDWQAVENAKTGWAVLVVCKRCAASSWVGSAPPAPQMQMTVADGTRGMERGR